MAPERHVITSSCGDYTRDVWFLPRPALWLSVGSEETATGVSHPPTGLFQRVSQIEGVKRAADRFEALGATVRYNMYSGGHAAAPWRAELAPALTWLVVGAR